MINKTVRRTWKLRFVKNYYYDGELMVRALNSGSSSQLLVLTGDIAVVFYRPNTLLAQYLSPLRFATLGVIVGVTLS